VRGERRLVIESAAAVVGIGVVVGIAGARAYRRCIRIVQIVCHDRPASLETANAQLTELAVMS